MGLQPTGLILTFASLQSVHPILAVPRGPQRPQLSRQNAIVPPGNGKAAEGRDGTGAICSERGSPSPCSSGDPLGQSLVGETGAGAGGRVWFPCCLQPGKWCSISPPGVPVSLPSCHPPVAIASGREEGSRDLVSISNMWSVAMAMPFDVASGRDGRDDWGWSSEKAEAALRALFLHGPPQSRPPCAFPSFCLPGC